MMAADIGFSSDAVEIDSVTSQEVISATEIQIHDTVESEKAAAAEVIALGDFNDDGYEDMAIGMPDRDVNLFGDFAKVADAGAVRILYGSINGLFADHPGVAREYWTQDEFSTSHAEAGDHFGASLAVGDFNGDGYDDLAIGSPGENGGRGMVQVLFGGFYGLTDVFSVGSVVSSTDGEAFGASLATGDFDNEVDSFDRRDDELVIGTPGANDGRGEVHIYEVTTDEFTLQQTLAGKGRFGSAVAVGDFNGDQLDDLAVGAPNRDIRYEKWQLPSYRDAKYVDAGVVEVFHGAHDALNESPARTLSQDYRQREGGPLPTAVKGLPGRAESNDHFGSVLAVGNFDGDQFDDLAIGTPDEDIDRFLEKYDSGATVWDINPEAGAVNVVFGSTSGVQMQGSQIWHQGNNHGTPDLPGEVEAGDRFGFALAVGDFDGDRLDDLAVGVPFEDWGGQADAGVVQMLVGDRDRRLAAFPIERPPWTDPMIENLGRFGLALGAGDVNGDGKSDLAVSAPHSAGLGVSVSGQDSYEADGSDASVHLLFGTDDPNGPGADRIQTWYEASQTLESINTANAQFSSAFALEQASGDLPLGFVELCATFNTLGLGETPITMEDGTVTVEGTNGNDSVIVSAEGDLVTVSLVRLDDSGDELLGWQRQFAAEQVRDIVFRGYDGDDRFVNETAIASRAYGHDGRDELFGGSGLDWLDGGRGNDVLHGGSGNDTLEGGRGTDYLYGENGNDRLYGEFADSNSRYGERDFLYGGAGNDYLYGRGGDDRLYGGSGHDRLYGDRGDDRLYGGGGHDRLYGGDGVDYLRGHSGNDYLDGGRDGDRDYLRGDSGYDTFNQHYWSYFVWGRAYRSSEDRIADSPDRVV